MDIYFEKIKPKNNEFQLDTDINSGSHDSIKYNIFADDSKQHVGSIEGYLGNDNEFITVVRIDPNFQCMGIGFKAFNKVYQELNSINTITKICGSWHKDEEFSECDCGMSSNLKIFKEESRTNQNLSEYAFKTPKGKWQ